MDAPGKILLMGSGETAPNMQPVYTQLFLQLESPVRAAIVETPAGFEPNAAAVAGQIAAYLERRLQNFHPTIWQIPARTRTQPFSTDDPDLAATLYDANLIFMGPGSPTYAVRQLRDSLVWWTIQTCHRLGATLIFASAGVLALSAYTLPVYEIYKVGEDLHWKPGLDFFGAFGLSLVFISHWNNNDGGDGLDTSRCYMGRKRFAQLVAQLPGEVEQQTIVGIDEKTALIIDLRQQSCAVNGAGSVTIMRKGKEQVFKSKSEFPIEMLGNVEFPASSAGIPAQVWNQTQKGIDAAAAMRTRQPSPPAYILALANERAAARQRKDWAVSDQLRNEIGALGWRVLDTPTGFVLENGV